MSKPAWTLKHEPEVMRAKARGILEAMEEGERIERLGLPTYCHRMMTTCHRAAGKCECDEYDRRAGSARPPT